MSIDTAIGRSDEMSRMLIRAFLSSGYVLAVDRQNMARQINATPKTPAPATPTKPAEKRAQLQLVADNPERPKSFAKRANTGNLRLVTQEGEPPWVNTPKS